MSLHWADGEGTASRPMSSPFAAAAVAVCRRGRAIRLPRAECIAGDATSIGNRPALHKQAKQRVVYSHVRAPNWSHCHSWRPDVSLKPLAQALDSRLSRALSVLSLRHCASHLCRFIQPHLQPFYAGSKPSVWSRRPGLCSFPSHRFHVFGPRRTLHVPIISQFQRHRGLGPFHEQRPGP